MKVTYASAEITEYSEGRRTAKSEACSICIKVLEDKLMRRIVIMIRKYNFKRYINRHQGDAIHLADNLLAN